MAALKAGPAAGEQQIHFRDTSNKGDFSPFQKAAAALERLGLMSVVIGIPMLVALVMIGKSIFQIPGK